MNQPAYWSKELVERLLLLNKSMGLRAIASRMDISVTCVRNKLLSMRVELFCHSALADDSTYTPPGVLKLSVVSFGAGFEDMPPEILARESRGRQPSRMHTVSLMGSAAELCANG